ncbi:MAG: sugar transferase [Actinomycetota bacterium]|nr:sugar transferase [Actinomycetota bacterium]
MSRVRENRTHGSTGRGWKRSTSYRASPSPNRHPCKPGITGMWQVAGRNHLSYEERVRLNVYYVDNWRLALDVKLLAKTAMMPFTCHGAF